MAITDTPPTTTNYSIELPTVNGSRNVWGTILNSAMDTLSQKTYNADNTLGIVSDTSSLAYSLSQASTNATTAASDASTARTVAVKLVNNALVSMVSTINTLNTASTAASANATTAAADALSAKTTAEGLV